MLLQQRPKVRKVLKKPFLGRFDELSRKIEALVRTTKAQWLQTMNKNEIAACLGILGATNPSRFDSWQEKRAGVQFGDFMLWRLG